jgi:hypothetical protein
LYRLQKKYRRPNKKKVNQKRRIEQLILELMMFDPPHLLKNIRTLDMECLICCVDLVEPGACGSELNLSNLYRLFLNTTLIHQNNLVWDGHRK